MDPCCLVTDLIVLWILAVLLLNPSVVRDISGNKISERKTGAWLALYKNAFFVRYL